MEMARDAIHKQKLGNVIGGFISPVHQGYGKKSLVEPHHRLEMVRRAVESSDWISVDPWEIEQPNYTFTLPVMERFDRELNGDNQGPDKIKIRLVCGADLLDSFRIPGVWAEEHTEAIMRDYGLACIERQGSVTQEIIDSHPVLKKYEKNIIQVPSYIVNNVSSTSVRQHVKDGLSIKYLTVDGVVDYIHQHGLFLQ
eukprot:TRINITY_DN890_c0_g1_i1.p1 TRINITY_DN890_c0_g1~~TRINITY_DN890_c0_g1_i1.p1  ORF type:complete len:197 (+),score=39.44 TRINITY_DN890_c0_g1_i1:155-745(+)